MIATQIIDLISDLFQICISPNYIPVSVLDMCHCGWWAVCMKSSRQFVFIKTKISISSNHNVYFSESYSYFCMHEI